MKNCVNISLQYLTLVAVAKWELWNSIRNPISQFNAFPFIPNDPVKVAKYFYNPWGEVHIIATPQDSRKTTYLRNNTLEFVDSDGRPYIFGHE